MTEKLTELLNHLHVAVEEMDSEYTWKLLLKDAIQSSGGTQHLSHSYWELLVGLAMSKDSDGVSLNLEDADALKVAKSLIDAEEWDKLECWTGIAWMCCTSAVINTKEGLKQSTLLLLRHRPGAAQKLEQWTEQRYGKWALRFLRPIITRAREEVQRQDAP